MYAKAEDVPRIVGSFDNRALKDRHLPFSGFMPVKGSAIGVIRAHNSGIPMLRRYVAIPSSMT